MIRNPELRSSVTIIVAASDSLHKDRADYVCDGTDDQVEIQAAIDALPSGGGKVLLMEGIFNINNEIKLADYTHLQGNGFQNTILKAVADSNFAILRNETFAGQSDLTGNVQITISDLQVDANSAEQTETVSPLVFNNADDCLLERCLFKNADYYSNIYPTEVGSAGATSALTLSWGKRNKIINCVFDDIDYALLDFSYNADYHIVSNCVFQNAPVTAIYQIGSYAVVTGNNFKNIPGTVWSPHTNSHHSIFVGNSGYNCVLVVSITLSNHCVVSGNSFATGTSPVKIAQGNRCVIENNVFTDFSSDTVSVWGAGGSNYNRISNNIFYDVDEIGLRLVEGDNNIFENNYVGGSTRLPSNGVEISSGVNRTIIRNNMLLDYTGSAIVDGGTNTIYFDTVFNFFMDALAVSAIHVRANEDLSAATPIIFTIDAQPDIPRTLSAHFDSHAQITEYDIEITGIDAKGNTVTETKDETDSWDWETDNAFATVTSIKLTSRTGTGVGDTMDVGITDVLGLSNVFYETSDIFKIKKNNANVVVAGAQVNTYYHTYDMSVIGLAATDDFTIWYRSNLNVIS